jgi:hypothetical protein
MKSAKKPVKPARGVCDCGLARIFDVFGLQLSTDNVLLETLAATAMLPLPDICWRGVRVA